MSWDPHAGGNPTLLGAAALLLLVRLDGAVSPSCRSPSLAEPSCAGAGLWRSLLWGLSSSSTRPGGLARPAHGQLFLVAILGGSLEICS